MNCGLKATLLGGSMRVWGGKTSVVLGGSFVNVV
jgi:hypothetical protein